MEGGGGVGGEGESVKRGGVRCERMGWGGEVDGSVFLFGAV